MKLITWNVNGLRAVEKKEELRSFLDTYQPDVLCIQETKAQPEQLIFLEELYPKYEKFYFSAIKKGYAGTGIWVNKDIAQDQEFSSGLPGWENTEGRVSRVDFGDVSVLGVYFPNGGKSAEAWEGKLEFYDHFLAYVNTLRSEGRTVLWTGDVNCAHNYIDLARPKDNDGKIGFHPKERAWLDRVVADGWVDVYRDQYPEGVVYSWWHLISRARSRNVGWRIDYWFVDKKDMPKVEAITYLTQQMGSDHCPVLLEIEL